MTSELGVKNMLFNGLHRVFNICCLVSVAVVTIAVSTAIKDSCSKTPTPYSDEMEPENENNKLDLEIPPYHLPECDESPYDIRHGHIVPLLHIQYTIMCDEHHTIPLGSREFWECKSAWFTSRNVVEIADREFRVSECVEKKLPEIIYIERGVHIYNAKPCQSGVDAYIKEFSDLFYKTRTFLIRGLKFFLQFVPELSECAITINNKSLVLQEWNIHLKFRLAHKPIYRTLTDSLFNETNCWLAAAVAEIMVEYIETNPGATYDLEEQENVFHPGPCSKPGSMVEKIFRAGFKNDVPFCRSCMRGYYLDKELASCRACKPNHYAGSTGATECIPCPTIHTKYMSPRGDSIMDCYAWVTKSNMTAVNRGIVFMVTFHLAYIALVIWSVKRRQQVSYNTRGRSEDDHM